MLFGNLVEAHTPISSVTYVTGVKAARNRKMMISCHPLQLISNPGERKTAEGSSLRAFTTVNCSSSDPILQAICFNLNQDFSSPLLRSHSGLSEEIEQHAHMLSF